MLHGTRNNGHATGVQNIRDRGYWIKDKRQGTRDIGHETLNKGRRARDIKLGTRDKG